MKRIPVLICLLFLTSLSLNAQNAAKDSAIYRAAIQDAMYPEQSKVYKDLVRIDKSNEDLIWKNVNGKDYLLVVTWKGQKKFFAPYLNWGYYNTQSWPLWVTTAPQLLNHINWAKEKNPDRRLKELLGLPPNSEYNYFVELWVDPNDLFRPCPDNEIDDQQCDVCFPKDVDSTYRAWVNNSRISRYYPDSCGLYFQYPWTALGYTYDYNPKNKSHVGLSEFVLGVNKNAVVNAIYTTEEYLKKGRRK